MDNNTNVLDISLAREKRKIRIDKDDNRIIELDTTDITILKRLQEAYPRLNELGMKGFEMDDTEDGITIEALTALNAALDAVDKEMRDIMDYIFDSKISDICVPSGALYNMQNGEFTFERILDVLFGVYADNIQQEFGKLSDRMKAHTDKYTGKSKKK